MSLFRDDIEMFSPFSLLLYWIIKPEAYFKCLIIIGDASDVGSLLQLVLVAPGYFEHAI